MKTYKYRVIKKFVLDKIGDGEYKILSTFPNRRDYNRSYYKKGVTYWDYDVEDMVQHPITQILLDTGKIIPL